MVGGISSGPLHTPHLTPGHSAYLVIPSRDAVQAVILLQQVNGLAQETERGRVQGFREGQGQTQSHSDEGRAKDGTQKSCLLPPLPNPHCLHSSFLLSTQAQHLPSYLCSGFSPTFEVASSRKLSKTFHCLFPGDPVKQRGPMQLIEAAWRGTPLT